MQTSGHAIFAMFISLKGAWHVRYTVVMLLSSVRLECFQIRKTQEAAITHQLGYLQSVTTRDHGLQRCTILGANDGFGLGDSEILRCSPTLLMISPAVSTKLFTNSPKSIQHRCRDHRISNVHEPCKKRGGLQEQHLPGELQAHML